MSEFLESSDKSYVLYADLVSGSGNYSFYFPVTVRQFVVLSDINCEVTWQNNSGSLPLLAGENFNIPCRTREIIITPASSGLVRIIGIN
jgi:hypothetical protein